MKFLVPFPLLVNIASHVEWRKAPAALRPQLSVVEVISQPLRTTSCTAAVGFGTTGA